MAEYHSSACIPQIQLAPEVTSLKSKRTLNKSTRRPGFLDLPAEVRGIIYDYVFHLAVLRIGENGVDIEDSDADCAILGSCRTISLEATPHLFTKATQFFTHYAEDAPDFPRINLCPLQPSLVPSMEVMCDRPNYVRLDMRVLKTYTSLRELTLGTFAFISLEEDTPYVLLDTGKPGEWLLNDANDMFMVTVAKEALNDKEKYKKLDDKPITFHGLKCMLSSKYRKFSVNLKCRLEVYGGDGSGDFVVRLTEVHTIRIHC